MSLGTLLQTIITAIFIYLILSLLASEIQEYIASILEFRAKRLKESIKQLLGEDDYSLKNLKPSKKSKTEIESTDQLTDLLYNNYLIPSLNQSAANISNLFGKNRKTIGPSYIEPKLFAQALLQTIQDNLVNQPEQPNQLGDEQKLTKPDFTTKSNLVEKLRKIKCNSAAKDKLIKIADELFLEEEHPNISHFKTKIEELFEEAQVRSSGVYKRNAKGLSFVLGLVIAMIANADSFNIVSNLSKDNNNFRERVVNELEENQSELFPNRAEGNAQDTFGEDKKELVRSILDEVGTLPLGWNFAQELETQNLSSLIEVLSQKKCFNEASENVQCFEQFLENIEKQPNLGNYIRQDKKAKQFIEELDKIKSCLKSENKKIEACLPTEDEQNKFPTTYATYRQNLENQLHVQRIENIKTRNKINFANQVNKQGGWWQVGFGWVISAIAISMGAPFWFDLLGKVMNVRNTKKSPKTDSIEEEKTLEN